MLLGEKLIIIILVFITALKLVLRAFIKFFKIKFCKLDSFGMILAINISEEEKEWIVN